MESSSSPDPSASNQRLLSRILVVDDDHPILEMLRRCLSHVGHEVDVSNSIPEAREKLKQGDFRVVLCDVCMPGESGLDLLHEIAPMSPEIAMIMMTGNADLDVAIDSLRDGAFDFLPKPFRLNKVLEVTERALSRQRRLMDQKRLLERRLETMARFTEDVHNPVFQINNEGKILYANEASSYLVQQWGNEEEIPAPLQSLVSQKFSGQSVDEYEMTFGTRTYSFSVTEPVDGKLVYLYGYDTTDLKAAQEDLLRLKNDAMELARTDHLTGLPNRLSFSGAISDLQPAPEGEVTAVVMMDVNKFKQINDNFGHATGDQVLVAIAHSIKRHLRPRDLVFRWGGDEILIILPRMESRSAAESFLKNLNHNVSKDVREDVSFDISLSSGFAFWPADGADIEHVVIKADDALFRNKAASFSCWQINKEENEGPGDDQSDEELFLQLTTAVDGKEIDVHFQPIIDSATNYCISVEALARWNTSRGPISPGRFIPLADARGLAPSLGDLIITESLRYLSRLRNEGFEVDMSINLSQWQLQESGFADSLTKIAASFELEPAWICLEISEKYPLFNNSLYCNRIIGLRDAGFKIALDDFGTGFSTLQALADLPVDQIKLDRSIVERCATTKGAAILSSMAELANSLNLELVAEGVETDEQREHLNSLGITLFQGYHFQRPSAQNDLFRYLKSVCEPAGSP